LVLSTIVILFKLQAPFIRQVRYFWDYPRSPKALLFIEVCNLKHVCVKVVASVKFFTFKLAQVLIVAVSGAIMSELQKKEEIHYVN
jgi:hypothetical protein